MLKMKRERALSVYAQIMEEIIAQRMQTTFCMQQGIRRELA